MPHYVDGFVCVVPKKNVRAYRAMAHEAGRIWMEYGAPRIAAMIKEHGDLFDMKRMSCGGFKPVVALSARTSR